MLDGLLAVPIYLTIVAFLVIHEFKAKMDNPLLKKLEALTDLPVADRCLVDKTMGDVHHFDAREAIIRKREHPDHVLLMLSGWASRYEILADGTKQITAFLLPGDFCNTHITSLVQTEHSINANIPCRVAFVSKDAMTVLFDRPAIARALWLSSLADERIVRAWLVNLGARNGLLRTAHLLCELYVRLSAIGLVDDSTFTLPLTQEQIGQALGLTAVHVNRMLRQLQDLSMIYRSRNRISIIKYDQLRSLCNFGFDYLYLPSSHLVKT